jgi:type II secretory pathway pseudopilin PulG
MIMKKKNSFTLLEIMIVIFLIGLIGSVIGYNMRGSLEKGKVFRTEEGIKQVHDILLLQIAEGADIQKVVKRPIVYLKNSKLVKDPEKMILDGWNKKLVFEEDDGDILIRSESLEAYKEKQDTKSKKKPIEEQYEE